MALGLCHFSGWELHDDFQATTGIEGNRERPGLEQGTSGFTSVVSETRKVGKVRCPASYQPELAGKVARKLAGNEQNI